MPPPVLLLPVLLLLLLLPVELVLLWGDFCCGIPFTMPMFSTLMLPVVVMVLLLLLLWWILLLLKLLMMVLLLLLAEFFRLGDVPELRLFLVSFPRSNSDDGGKQLLINSDCCKW